MSYAATQGSHSEQFGPPSALTGRSGMHPVMLAAAMLMGAASMYLMATPWYWLALAPPLFMLLLFGLSLRPEIGFYIMLFLVPWESVRAVVGRESPVTISKVLGASLLLVVFLNVMFAKRITYDVRSNLWGIIGLFLAVALATCIASDFPMESWGDMRKLVTSVLVFGLALSLIHDRGFSKTVPRIIIFSIGLGTAMSVIAFVKGSELFAMNEEMRRLIGGAYNPNHYASFVLFSMPLLAHWFFNARRNRVRLLGGIIFTVNVAALVLTFSRGAALVSIVVFTLLAWEHGRRIRPKHLGFVALGMAITVLAGYLLIPATYWERQKSISVQDSSVSSRLSYIDAGVDSWLRHPLMGTGLGTFDRVYSYSEHAFTEGWNRRTREDARRDAHNTYLEIVVGMGTLGIMLFLGLIVVAFLNFTKAKEASRKLEDPKFTQLIGAYRLSFISILSYFMLLSRPYSDYFWISLALSCIAVRVVSDRLEAKAAHASQIGQADTIDNAPVPR